MATPAKTHEKNTIARMERAGLVLPTPMGDGLVYTGNVNRPLVHDHDVPADIVAATRTGRIVMCECKHREGRNLPCERSLRESIANKNRRTTGGKKASSFAGLKWHQAESIMKVSAVGGIGIVVVEFARAGVWLLDGHGLRVWIERGDSEDEIDRKSISLQHFKDYGIALGIMGDWKFPAGYFDDRKPAAIGPAERSSVTTVRG